MNHGHFCYKKTPFILSMVGRNLTHQHGKLGPEMEEGTVKIVVRTDLMWHALLLSQRQANPSEFTQDKGITSPIKGPKRQKQHTPRYQVMCQSAPAGHDWAFFSCILHGCTFFRSNC